MTGESSDLEILKEEIKKAKELGNKRIHLILGAGVTIFLTDKSLSWKDILKNGLNVVNDRFYGILSEDEKTILKNHLESLDNRDDKVDNFLEIADFIQKQLTKDLQYEEGVFYSKWLKDTFHIKKERILKDRFILIDSLKHAIKYSAKLITTNYDTLIADSIDSCNRYNVPNIGSFINYDKYLPCILHLHGTCDKPKDVIFSKHYYDDYFKTYKEQEKEILNLFNPEENLNIFIGCGNGLNDPNFKTFFEFYKKVINKHQGKEHGLYILLPKNEKFEIQQRLGDIIRENIMLITFNDFKDLPYLINEIFSFKHPLKQLKTLFNECYNLFDKVDKNGMVFYPNNVSINKINNEINKLLYINNKILNFANNIRTNRYLQYSKINDFCKKQDFQSLTTAIESINSLYKIEKNRINRNGLIIEELIEELSFILEDDKLRKKENYTLNIIEYYFSGTKINDLAKFLRKAIDNKKSKIKITSVTKDRETNIFENLIIFYYNILINLKYLEDTYRKLERIKSLDDSQRSESFYQVQNFRIYSNEILVHCIKFNKYLIKLQYGIICE